MIKIRALRENEKEELYDLLYRSYVQYADKNPFLGRRETFKQRIESDPFFSLDLNRVLEVDGKLVARIGIYDRQMYFKGDALRVGAIGGVCTDPAHRGKGYVKMLLEDCSQYMKDNKFDVSLLFGLPAVYGGSGWQTLSSFGIKTNFRMNRTGNVHSSPVTEIAKNSATLSKIYDQFSPGLNGPFLRSKSYWDTWFKHRISACNAGQDEVILVYEADRPAGYYIVRNKNLILEMAYERKNKNAFIKIMECIISNANITGEITFNFFLQEIFDYLSAESVAPSLDEIGKQEYYVKKTALYCGLFKLIINSSKTLRGVNTTGELLALFRNNNYIFWDCDHF